MIGLILDASLFDSIVNGGVSGAILFGVLAGRELLGIAKRCILITDKAIVYYWKTPIGIFRRLSLPIEEILSVETFRSDHKNQKVFVVTGKDKLIINNLSDETADWLGRLLEAVVIQSGVRDHLSSQSAERQVLANNGH